jgi:hypothetical protein
MSDTRIELDRAIREIVATHARTWPKTLTPQALINGLHALAVEVAQVAKAREARTDGSVSFCPDGETQEPVNLPRCVCGGPQGCLGHTPGVGTEKS